MASPIPPNLPPEQYRQVLRDRTEKVIGRLQAETDAAYDEARKSIRSNDSIEKSYEKLLNAKSIKEQNENVQRIISQEVSTRIDNSFTPEERRLKQIGELQDLKAEIQSDPWIRNKQVAKDLIADSDKQIADLQKPELEQFQPGIDPDTPSLEQEWLDAIDEARSEKQFRPGIDSDSPSIDKLSPLEETGFKSAKPPAPVPGDADFIGPVRPNEDTGDVSSRISAGYYENFLTRLGEWSTAVPLQNFWVILMSVPNGVRTWIDKLTNEGLDEYAWSRFQIDAFDEMVQKTETASDDFIYGCFLARNITIPGDGIELDTVKIQNDPGLLYPSISRGRMSTQNLTISFLETNNSYIDNVLRPWSVVSSYTGLVSRTEGEIKGSIEALFFGKSDELQPTTINGSPTLTLQGRRVIKRKRINFYNVVPVNINAQEYSYIGDAVLTRPVRFTYTSYSVATPST